jgi:hypothetical protein
VWRDQHSALLVALPGVQNVAALILRGTHRHLGSPAGRVQGSMLPALLLRAERGLAAEASAILWKQRAIQACRRG